MTNLSYIHFKPNTEQGTYTNAVDDENVPVHILVCVFTLGNINELYELTKMRL